MWELVRPLNFAYNPAVEKTVLEGKAIASEGESCSSLRPFFFSFFPAVHHSLGLCARACDTVGGIRAVTYKDAKDDAKKTVQKIKLVELSGTESKSSTLSVCCPVRLTHALVRVWEH